VPRAATDEGAAAAGTGQAAAACLPGTGCRQDAALALARLQPAEKLADFLLRLAAREAKLGGDGLRVSLPMGRGDIADHLGLTMETVSRTFTKLRQQG
jgi:CRP/FNR family transcriptional regulator